MNKNVWCTDEVYMYKEGLLLLDVLQGMDIHVFPLVNMIYSGKRWDGYLFRVFSDVGANETVAVGCMFNLD